MGEAGQVDLHQSCVHVPLSQLDYSYNTACILDEITWYKSSLCTHWCRSLAHCHWPGVSCHPYDYPEILSHARGQLKLSNSVMVMSHFHSGNKYHTLRIYSCGDRTYIPATTIFYTVLAVITGH
jgi:hypothetical protein